MSDYDVITVGGGLAGASLAMNLAARGLRVLVLEREERFKDRVRGEQMHPWGVAEAKELGVHALLERTCGHDLPWWDLTIGSREMPRRDLTATTPQKAPEFSFYHPAMQEVLIDAAREAGADVRRGAKVREVGVGERPGVAVEYAADPGRVVELGARLVVGADGRGSLTRSRAGFAVQQDPPGQAIAGLLFDDCPAEESVAHAVMNPRQGRGAVAFPQGGGRVRTYLIYPASAETRLSGDQDVARYIQDSIDTGAPPERFESAKPAGPLASFESADVWVDHPYRDGVVLVGDAAAANDPSLGEGLSLTLRDVRVLRDRLLESDDWDAAGHAYAEEHDRHYGVIHKVSLWMCQLIFQRGAEADARRARALPLIAQDPTRVPDHTFSGPDLPFDEPAVRARLFGEA